MSNSQPNIRLADFLPTLYRESRKLAAVRRRLIDQKTQKLVDHLAEFKDADEPKKRKAAQIRRGVIFRHIREREVSSQGLRPDPWDFAISRVTAATEVTVKQLNEWASRIALNAPPTDPHVVKMLRRLDREGFSAALIDEIRHQYPEAVESHQLTHAPVEEPSRSTSQLAQITPASEEKEPILDKPDVCILRVLAKAPNSLTQLDIAERTKRVIRSRRALGPRLERLRQAGLIHRPKGIHGGDAITSKGRKAISP
jgi:hypothetical protein